MPTFIKTGFWDKMISNNPVQAKAPKGWLNLDQFVNSKLSGNTSNTCPLEMRFKPGSVGPKVSFIKESGSDPNTNKDVIIPGELEITRGNNGGGIYNIALESDYNSSNSPENTAWNTQYVDAANTSWAPLWDVQDRNYTDWRDAVKMPNGDENNRPPQYVGIYSVMIWDNGDDDPRYWLIKFTQWGVGDTGDYGFAYERYEIFSRVYFERPDNQPNVVDVISAGVHIKRNDNSSGLYNPVVETQRNSGVSPANTKWNSRYVDSRPGYSGWDDLSNLESRVYTSFRDAVDNDSDNINDGDDFVMWDMTTDLYYKIRFNSWSQNDGSEFSYYRTVIPQSCGIKFADGTVLNTASTGGGGSTTGPITIENTTSLFSTGLADTGLNSIAENSNFFGSAAGSNATSASYSNFLGREAGNGATDASNSNFFGTSAGQGATNAEGSNFLGNGAGQGATDANDSNFFGRSAGNSATNAYNSNFIGDEAGNDATNANNSNFLGNEAGSSATNANNSNFLGNNAGVSATEASNSNFLGNNAGEGATNASDSNFLGLGAGRNATNANGSNFFGYEAGYESTNAGNSNFIGFTAGYDATNAFRSNFIGQNAGKEATNAANSIFIGRDAGNGDTVDNTENGLSSILIGNYNNTGGFSNSILLGSGANESPIANTKENQFMLADTITDVRWSGVEYTLPSSQAENAGDVLSNDGAGVLSWVAGGGGGSSPITIQNTNSLFSTGLSGTGEDSTAEASNFFGENAGFEATYASYSNFLGYQAGFGATGDEEEDFKSNFIGYQAGYQATNAQYSNFFGDSAGRVATNASFSNFLGNNAGNGATEATNSNFIGNGAGGDATYASYSNFFGRNAGLGATTASYSNFLGENAGINSTGNNVNAFGTNAGDSNALNGQTIFSNSSMPSFADHAAAAAAITVLLGASAGSTYLYHNQATNSIGAVRL